MCSVSPSISSELHLSTLYSFVPHYRDTSKLLALLHPVEELHLPTRELPAGVLVTAMERAEVTTTGGEGRHLMAEVRTGEDQILEEVEVPPATSRVTGEAGLLLTQGVRGKESLRILSKQRGIFFH